MSGKGNCYDNACAESFFSTLKGECADSVFESRAIAKTSIFEYIEIWYNRERLHSTLGYLSPLEFEIREGQCPINCCHPKELLERIQYLEAENDYLKKLNALVAEREKHGRESK